MENDKKKSLKPASGLSKAGFVCGILSICLFWFFGVGQILAVLSHVFSGIAVSRNEQLGKAGLVLGIVSWVPLILYFVFFAAWLSSASTAAGY